MSPGLQTNHLPLQLFDAISFSLMLVSVRYGVGRHNYYLPADEEMLAEKWLFLSQPPFPWSLAFSKVSIAWMLLRLQREKRWWCWTMYFLMFVSVGVAVTSNIFQLTICKPLEAVWDHTITTAVCSNPKTSQISIYVTSSLTIVTDVALSFAVRASRLCFDRAFRNSERADVILFVSAHFLHRPYPAPPPREDCARLCHGSRPRC